MQTFKIEVETRDYLSKSEIKKLRKNGLVPAIIYGKSLDKNIMIQLPERALVKAFHEGLSEATIVNLVLKDKKEDYFTVIREIQRHPVTEKLVHIDFLAISMDEPISVEVPIEIVGYAKGMKEGGLLEQPLKSLEIEALPNKIPNSIQVDVTELNIGDSIHVSDLKAEDYKILEDETTVVVRIAEPASEEEVTVENEEVEPEVIEKGKKEAEE